MGYVMVCCKWLREQRCGDGIVVGWGVNWTERRVGKVDWRWFGRKWSMLDVCLYKCVTWRGYRRALD